MPITLQPVLACGQDVATDLTVFRSRGGTTYEVYIEVALLERVGVDPEEVSHKMLVGRLFNAGVSLRELAETFHHDGRTIKKWAAATLSADVDEMARAFAGRGGAGKVTPELIRYARQLYRERHLLGRNYREVIIGRIHEVFRVTVSPTTASCIFRAEKDKEEQAGACAAEREKGACGEQNGAISSSESPCSVRRSPTPLPAQTCQTGGVTEQLVPHAGQALFADGMQGFSDPVQRRLIGQILQGAVNVEQSNTICGRSLAHFTGPVLTVLKDQRDALARQAGLGAVLDVYERNAELLADGPNRGDLFYFDPHTKEYTGLLKILKGWCGRRHGIVKVMNMDTFHTRSGRPCFVQHYSAYYDMRERFFMSLALFDQLFDEDKRRGRTFVIDRGIYALAALQAFDRDDIITWEKDYKGDGWKEGQATVAFTRSLKKNHRADDRFITFQCQESPWRPDRSFRRIIVRVSRPGADDIEVSILTSHPDMGLQDVVWAIFRRWLQENDFKYLDGHFGLNQLTSRDSFSFGEQAGRFRDRPVDCPEYKELKNALHAVEGRLGKRLVQLRRCRKQGTELEAQQAKLQRDKARLASRVATVIDRLRNSSSSPRGGPRIEDEIAEFRRRRSTIRRKVRANTAKREKLRGEIEQLEMQIEPLERRLCEAVRKKSRLHLLIDGQYRLLDTRKKSMMDALRIAASNIFRNVQEQFRAIYDNFRDDHALVRMLSRCSGTLTKTADEVVFTLRLPGTLQPHRIRAFEALLANVEQQTNDNLGSAKPVRLRLTAGPMTL